MPNKFNTRRCLREAFTLIEMLTVLIVMSVLIAVVAPNLLGIINSTRMTSAGDSLINFMNLAQQEAIATNIPTEIRFYKYSENEGNDSQSLIRAYQVVRLGRLGHDAPSQDDEGAYALVEAVTEPAIMDSTLAISETEELSPILQNFFPEGEEIFKRSAAEYAAVRFYPDGSFRVPTRGGAGAADEVGVVSSPLDESYLTITAESDVESSGSRLKNYYCIQVDPFTGKSRVYRP